MNFNKTVKLLALGFVIIELILDHMPRMTDPGNVHSEIHDVKRCQSVKPEFPTVVRI